MAQNELGSLVMDLRLQTAQFIQGVNKTQSQIKRLNKQVASFGQTFAGVFSGYMAVQGVKATITMAAEIENLSRMARLGVEDFQALAFATDKYGVNAEKLADISKDVTDKLGDFIATGGGGMKDFFETVAPQIGLTASALQGLSGPEVLQAVKNAMDAANISAEEQVFYLEAIANDASRLAPLLADNGREWQALAEEAREFNTVLSQTDLQTLKDFDRQMTTIGKTLQVGFAKGVVGAAEHLKWFTDYMADAMAAIGSNLDSLNDIPNTLDGTFIKLADLLDKEAELNEKLGKMDKAYGAASVWDALFGGPTSREEVERELAEIREQIGLLQEQRDKLQNPVRLAPPTMPTVSGVGAGTGMADDLVGDVGRLESELATEREALESWYAERLELLKTMKAQESQLEAAGVTNVASLHDALTDKLKDEYAERDAALKGSLDGAAAIYADYSASLEVTSEDIAHAATGWADEFTDTLTTMVTTGKLAFSDLANAIVADLVRMAIQMKITKPLFDAMMSYLPGGGGTTAAPTGHDGLVAGQGASGRAVPSALFAGAPRLHTGGYLKGGEVPAILRQGEGVFTPQQMAALGGKAVVVNVNNYGQDAVQVKQSGNAQQQIIDIIVGQVNGRINEDIARGQGVAGTLENTYGLRRNAF